MLTLALTRSGKIFQCVADVLQVTFSTLTSIIHPPPAAIIDREVRAQNLTRSESAGH